MTLGLGSGVHSGFIGEECNYALMTWNQNASQNGGWKVENVWDSGTAREVGDTVDITTKIYLSGSGDTWDAGTDDVSFKMNYIINAGSLTLTVPQNTLINVNDTSAPTVSANWANSFYLGWWPASDDYPDDGAVYYMSSVNLTLKASNGTVKETVFLDFSADSGVTIVKQNIAGGGANAATVTLGNCPPV
jgi:hypothetical protein|tara:strand:- start:160 stop:729 length:570 start_codon:yes stop_codon:yes gene_type:complete